MLDFPAEEGQILASYPTILLLLVALGFIRLQTAILIQCVVVGAWWQYGIGSYTWLIAATLVGLKLGEWIENRWRSAIDRANAEDGAEGTGNTKQNGETDRRQPVTPQSVS